MSVNIEKKNETMHYLVYRNKFDIHVYHVGIHGDKVNISVVDIHLIYNVKYK